MTLQHKNLPWAIKDKIAVCSLLDYSKHCTLQVSIHPFTHIHTLVQCHLRIRINNRQLHSHTQWNQRWLNAYVSKGKKRSLYERHSNGDEGWAKESDINELLQCSWRKPGTHKQVFGICKWWTTVIGMYWHYLWVLYLVLINQWLSMKMDLG